VGIAIGCLSAASFITRFVYTVISYTGPTLRSHTEGEELLRIAGWYHRFINVREGLQLTSGVTGLGESGSPPILVTS
jgi:hypothetical protein